MKRIFRLMMAAVLAFSLIASYSTTALAKDKKGYEAKEVRVALQPFPLYAPIFVAKEKGWLQDELDKLDVRVKWSQFSSGPEVNESFAAGQQDIGVMGDTPAIIAKSAGIDISVIGIAASSPKALAIIVGKNSKIKTLKDLKGKKVATAKGSYAHHLLVLLLQNNGLTINDIELINLSAADSQAALIKGDIDAAATWESFITRLSDEGVARVLADGTGIKKGALVIIAANKFAKKNPKLVEIFLKAYKRGADFIKGNPAEAAKIISPVIKLEPELLTKVLKVIDYNPLLQAEDIKELKKSETFLQDVKLIRTSVDINGFVDATYLKSAGIK